MQTIFTGGVFAQTDESFLGVVFTYEQAEQLFFTFPKINFAVCIDIPRAAIVTTVLEAKLFFDAKQQPSGIRKARRRVSPLLRFP